MNILYIANNLLTNYNTRKTKRKIQQKIWMRAPCVANMFVLLIHFLMREPLPLLFLLLLPPSPSPSLCSKTINLNISHLTIRVFIKLKIGKHFTWKCEWLHVCLCHKYILHMTQENTTKLERKKGAKPGWVFFKKLFIVCILCCFQQTPTNQSKHWRIIVGFININKIPFYSICTARLMQYLVVVYQLFIH